MMRLPMINHGAGPPHMDKSSGQDTTMASPRRRKSTMRVTLCPATTLVTVAKRHRCQIILATVTCFLACTIACNEGSSDTLCQNPLGTVPTTLPLQPDILLSQNTTGGILMKPNKYLLNHIVKGQTGLHAAGEKQHARSLQADSVGTTDQLSLPEAKWSDLSQISALPFKLDGKRSLHYKLGAAKKDKNGIDSKTLRLDTSLALDALAKMTGFSSKLSPKGLQASSKEDLMFSPHASKAVEVGTMDSNYPAMVPGTLSQAQSLLIDVDFLQYDSLHSAPKASAQPLKVSPDAASVAQSSTNSGSKQQAAVDSLTSDAWGLYKMTHFATLMAPRTSVDQKATRSSPTSVLPKFLASAPPTYRASKELSYLMSLTTSPTMAASPAVPTQDNLTMSTNFPESTSLEATNIGPTELITSRWPGSSPISTGVASHEPVVPVWLGTVPGMHPGFLTPSLPSGESFLDTSPSVTMPNQEHSTSELSAIKFVLSALPVGMSQSTNLLPAPVSTARLPSAKPMASTSASAPLHVGDLSHFTEHPSPGPLTVPDTLAGPTEGVETEEQFTAAVLMAASPTVRESINWPVLPVHVSTTAQSSPPSSAPVSPLKVTLPGVVHASSVEVSSGFPSQSGVGTDLPIALSGHSRTRAHIASVPKPATAGLGQLLVLTTSLSDVPADHSTPSSLVLEETFPEASAEQTIVPGVPHSLVTSSNTLSDVEVSDVTQLTGGVTEGPPSVAARVGLSSATHPLDPLKLDAETSSTSSTERILPVKQLGHKLEERTTEMACAGSDSTSCPTWVSDLSTAVEQKGSPSLAITHAPANLTIVSPSQESMRGVSSKPDTLVAGTSQALTYSTVLANVKPVVGFLHEDTAANSLSHMLLISKGPRSQSSTSACCPEISPNVSRASTAANITSATLYRELSKTVKFLDKEQTPAAAEVVAKMPPGSSELPLGASSDALESSSVVGASSAKPQAQPARKHYSLRRPGMRRRLSTPADSVLSHSTTSPPSGTDIQPGPRVHTSPQNKTFPMSPSKTSSNTSVIMKTETNITHSTLLYLNRNGLALLAGSTPTGMEHTPVPITAAGVPVASTTAASEWKPTSATLGEHKVPGVATKAANFSGLASAESPVSVMTPAVGLTSTSMAVSKATPVKNTTAAPLPELSTTTLLTSINLTQSFGTNAPIFQPLTEAKPSVVTSLHSTPSIPPTTKTTALLTSARTSTTPGLQLPTVPKTTKLMPWNKTTVSTLLIPPTSTLSTHLLLISQHSSTAKTDLSLLTRTMTARKNLTTAAVTAKQVATVKTGLISKLILPESEVPTLSFSPRGKTGSANRPTSPSLQLPVHILSLQFRLIGIAYTELLKNKSSDGYKKLEKEVKLTLNKMLSSYENFLQANVLQFLNGSIIVESEALFQRDGPVPTNSDLIRTVITEVERKMDTFFDWRVDVKSVQSNGFSLENLEPEKLSISFTALRLGSIAAFGGVSSQGSLDQLNNVVVQSLGALYKVKNFSFVRLRDIKGDLEISGKAYIDTHAHADVSQVLQALRGLVNYSVDLTTLSVDDSRLSLQVFPISFLINNRTVNEKLLDHSSVEHQNLTRDLADVLMHALRKYQGLLQVVIRDFLSGSLICHGDVLFQHPGPASTDVLQTLVLSVGPGHMLAGSGFQVDPYSFTVADDQLEPPFVYPSFPGYAMAITVMCGLVIIAIPIVALLYLNSGLFGWHDKAIIQGGRDHEAGSQTFELDNQGFRSTIEEDDGRRLYTPTKLSARE
ncbi:mucin-17-like isoform X2 [Dermochelys coriacea]|uniref:mucin-17-like isoform X2 n=1 Tax=Dermochelys coriacea TaxID=27794 RepID=UPI0018E8223A|nr:mucin-17-like isoform X2 [Dermochelys coriacea]